MSGDSACACTGMYEERLKSTPQFCSMHRVSRMTRLSLYVAARMEMATGKRERVSLQ